MNDFLQLIPIDIRDSIAEITVDYEPMRTGSTEDNTWVQYPRYQCFIEDTDNMQGEGHASINEKTTPEEARLIAIERAVDNLLAWRSFQKQQEAR